MKIYCCVCDGQPVLYWEVSHAHWRHLPLALDKATEWAAKLQGRTVYLRTKAEEVDPQHLHIDVGDLFSLPGKPWLPLGIEECLSLAVQMFEMGIMASCIDLRDARDRWTLKTTGGDGANVMPPCLVKNYDADAPVVRFAN